MIERSESLQSGREREAEYDTRIARAMDRVLGAERAAQAAIAECEKESQEVLARARQEARTVLDRANERMVGLHKRASTMLEQRKTQEREHLIAGVDAGVQPLDRPRSEAAIQRLADSLLGQINGKI